MLEFPSLNGKVDQSEVLQTNHYYPFGLVHESNQVPQQGPENAYQYNGKELNSDFGLDWLDYGARWYDASIARWSAIDPLAEKYQAYSPYNYVLNNPIMFIDPDGKQVSFNISYDDNGEISGVEIVLTGKVHFTDGSGASTRNQKFVDKMNKSIQDTWKIEVDGDVDFKVTSNLTIAKTQDEIEESDHVVYIEKFLDRSTPGFDEHTAGYVNQIGGKAMYATRSTNIAHEVGHWFGLLHPKNYMSDGTSNNDFQLGEISKNNVMHHENDEWEGTILDNRLYDLSSSDIVQFKYAAALYLLDNANDENGEKSRQNTILNKGSNTYAPKNVKTRSSRTYYNARLLLNNLETLKSKQ